MTTIGEIVEAGYPGADESLIQHVLWGRTAYPFKVISPKELYGAASRLFRAKGNSIRLCDMCDRKIKKGWICARCDQALHGEAGS